MKRASLIAAATLALLLTIAMVPAARADETDQVNFTVDVTAGPQVGDTFTGSFTYDATTLGLTGIAPLESFTFTDPAWAGQSLSSTGVSTVVPPAAISGPPVSLFLFFAPGTGPNDAFSIDRAVFTTGTTVVVGESFENTGGGTVTYGTPFAVATPEPSSLLLLGTALPGLVLLRRRPA
ncbi:MAG TPA: PEP-CTERM sorting domain-containing protein [Candidatus Sulfotelmatobacter sp.]|nr:PEP-CTERM sorting domain-containing protein [Candidatus Sulfotelmatobacter sp.]